MYEAALISLTNEAEMASMIMAISLVLGIVFLFFTATLYKSKKDATRLACIIITIICSIALIVAFICFLSLKKQESDLRQKIEIAEAQKAEQKAEQERDKAIRESFKRQEEEERKAREEREAAKPIAEKLEEKLTEIRALRKDIDQKKADVINLRVHFVNTIDLLKADINTIREAEGIKTYSQAIRNQRIKNGLDLMRSKVAYKERVQEIEDGLTAAQYDLSYIEEKTVDDMKMSTVLSKEDMGKIIKQIENVITKYVPEARKLVINEADMKVKSTQSLWDSIARESKPTTIPPGQSNGQRL